HQSTVAPRRQSCALIAPGARPEVCRQFHCQGRELQNALVEACAFSMFAEHPARLGLDDKNLLKQWKPSYDAGYTMQASLVAASGILGLLAAWTSQNWHWIVGAVLILTNVPYTLIGIMPTNHKLEAISEADAGPNSRAMLVLWGKLHAVRTLLGVSATLAFLWALR